MSVDVDRIDSIQRSRSLAEQKVVSLASGIKVVLNNVRDIGVEVLDEIAAAIVAVKMYLKSRNGRKAVVNRNGESRHNGNGSRNRGILWFKSWLNEVSRPFDYNPYRREIPKDVL